jgi:peptide/nickel transport system permease protein
MRYLLRRIGFYLIALWASVTINFIIPRLVPGDPAEAMLAKMRGQAVTAYQLQALRVELGVNMTDPLPVQYWQYLVNVVHLNLGISSVNFPQTVSSVIAEHLPWTIGLVGVAVTLSFVLGTLIGIIVAWRRGTWLDSTVPPILTFISAIPYFWVALTLVYSFGFVLSWFPLSDGYDVYNTVPGFNFPFLMSVMYYGFLPVVTIMIGSLAGWVLPMRNTMVTTLSEDYVLMAQAKGLPERRVMLSYAARNAILPSVTSFSMSLALVVSGSLLTEMVFNYPGIGLTLYNAVEGHDYGLIQGCMLVVAVTVLVANFLSDLLYTFLDPRVRQGRS